MTSQISVGILGATGVVGQNYIKLLQNHPYFKINYLAASPNSKGKTFKEAVSGRWQMDTEIPSDLENIITEDASDINQAVGKVDLVFCCVELEKSAIINLEKAYAKAGIVVVSNNSALRSDPLVPMLIPEINSHHLGVIPLQQKEFGFEKGFIVVKSNCSLQSYMTPIFALNYAGFEVSKIIVTTLQAVSRAGYPGVSSLDMIDNLIPFISGEEEKTENEPLKILGKIGPFGIENKLDLKISATCTRVPVVDGHTATVSVQFNDQRTKPSKEEIKAIWENFKALPQELNLPFAPLKPLHYLQEENRPQPRKDRNLGKGMAVSIGRLRDCNILDYKFVGLSHNTIRGAAGGGILIAELLVTKKLL